MSLYVSGNYYIHLDADFALHGIENQVVFLCLPKQCNSLPFQILVCNHHRWR